GERTSDDIALLPAARGLPAGRSGRGARKWLHRRGRHPRRAARARRLVLAHLPGADAQRARRGGSTMSIAATSASPPRQGLVTRLAELVRPWRRLLSPIALLVLGARLLEVLPPPLLIRWIVDDHLAVGKSEGLLGLAFLYLGATALGQGLAFVYGYLAATVAQGVLSDLRVRLFAHLQRLPASYFDRTPLGDAISRCTADIDTLDAVFTSGVATLVANLFPLLTIAAAIIILSP